MLAWVGQRTFAPLSATLPKSGQASGRGTNWNLFAEGIPDQNLGTQPFAYALRAGRREIASLPEHLDNAYGLG